LAVAYPLFIYFTGFEPARRLSGLYYPRIHGYNLRPTPSHREYHGLDFSQVYLSARRLSSGEVVYYPIEDRDFKQWRRRWSSTYHPLIHWLYIPIGKLDFRTALIVHNLMGVALILLCAALVLRSAGCLGAFPSLAGVVLAAMYLTPTGLLHLERGQMDVYVAASFICIMALFGAGGWGWAIATGVLSTLKVPAWVFVGFYWSVGAALWGLRERTAWLVPGSILVLNLVLLSQVRDWLPAFFYVAENTSRAGPSFGRILPNLLAFSLPFVSTLAVAATSFAVLRARSRWADAASRRQLLGRISFPFAATLALQTVCGTPVTHDYRLVALLGLLPALAVWCARAEPIPSWLRHAVSVGFALVFLMAMRVRPFTVMGYDVMAYALLFSSFCFLAVALYLCLMGTPGRARPREPALG
jgi:hypothetical protein